ncbi:GNAT family N-acetyltransferase [Rugamonas sp. FT82W]|uniref:GNAT family N-acetyltransferase n=1 Tax=Duganella vulcania TaxID=2692166 RepID=A0A845G769_9BURK|nr:GNAT family N-acetyltransferase [Duganella vulcania]MYM90543.1 GNAT family N-acetyltransferase [Duganella vulcania]
MGYSLSALEAAHEVNRFTCGKPELDNYLQTTARQHQSKNISKTYVLTNDEDPTLVIGFFTMAIRPMTPKGDMPASLVKRLPNTIPGFTLGRLAVSEMHKGKGHGATLLMAAMAKAKAVANEVGGFALFVDAKDGEASSFYQKYGFTSFPSDPRILVIPIAHIPG